METHTHAPIATPSGRRAAASWVAGTGAFLLLAAAALFVAVNWDRIPANGKLAIVVTLTGVCITAGARLRETLPATGDVLLHLGALLVTVDVAAVAVHRRLPLDEFVLAEGLVCSAVYLVLGEAFRSSVLRWAATAAVVVAAAGLHATTPVPAGVPLVAAAFAALAVGRAQPATVWAMAGALVPLAGTTPTWACIAVGIGAAVVLGRQAELAEDERLAFAAITALVVGVGSGWMWSGLSGDVDVLVGAGAFLGVQLAVMAFCADPFWGRPADIVGRFAEVVAGITALPLSMGTVLWAASGWAEHDNQWALALVVVAAGWLAADVRRGDSFGLYTIFAAAGVAAAGVYVAPGAALAAGLTGAALLVIANRRHALDDLAPLYAMTAVALVFSSVLAAQSILRDGGVVVVLLVGLWAIASTVDETSGVLPRLAMGVPLLLAVGRLSNEGAIAVGLLAAVLFAVDSLRHDEPVYGVGAALSMQLVVGSMAAAAGLGRPAAGVSLAVGALVWAGLAAVVDDYWRLPFVTAAVVGVGLGFALATEDGRSMADVLMIAGALGIGTGIVRRQALVGHAGGLLVAGGVIGRLATSGIEIPELYALPVALHLLAAGWLARRNDPTTSSWITYTPAPLLFGVIALSERMSGGSAWHAVAAGGVAVLAVSLGGWHRLAGPLFAGTALLVTIAVHESLGTLASAPTWAWLAAGGTTLLAVGVALERSDQSPVEVGRRLVDVVQERFS